MQLLERELPLELLADALSSASEGAGRLVVVSGESGGGKTALVDAFLDRSDGPRLLRGACDDLVTPVPFGPILDLARVADPGLEAALLSGDRQRVFTRLLDLLERKPQPVVMVVEDAHWIDQASAEMLSAVAQRIDGLPLLLIVTMRPEGVDPGHPARTISFRAPADTVVRIDLEPLSFDAIAALTDPETARRVATVTGGNPFFVTQLLSSGGEITPSISDVVASQLSRLPPPTRRLLELVAVNPAGAEASLLDGVAPGWEDDIAAAEMAQIVDVSPAGVQFRHDLIRQAVESQMLASRRRAAHAAILDAALRLGMPPGRVVHHAAAAGVVDVLLEAAPQAAERARLAGSHREAAAHYRRMLEHADMLEPDRRAEILEECSLESWAIHDPELAERHARQALDLRRARGGPTAAIGRNLRRIARVRWFFGDGESAEALLDEAIDVMRGDGDSVTAELATALAYRGLVAGIRHSGATARPWVEEALDLIEDIQDDPLRELVLNDVGTVRYLHEGDPATLLESIAIAERTGLHIDVVRGHVNLAIGALAHRRYDDCLLHLRQADRHAAEHQVSAFEGLADATRAQLLFEVGEWDEAAALAEEVMNVGSFAKVPASTVLARLKVRRGDVDAADAISAAVEAAEQTGEAQRLVPAVGAAAELAWMQHRLGEFLPTLKRAHELAIQSRSPRWIGETSVWMRAAGELEEIPEPIEDASRHMISGSWVEAAAAWESVGAPYEAAVSRALSSEPEVVFEGLAELDRMRAMPMAKLTRDRLARLGVEKIPRGPRRATAANPAGLTARQMDVLPLVVEGLTNAEIADRLFLSVRTVDHHVAAILLKLEVESRRQIPERAAELDLL